MVKTKRVNRQDQDQNQDQDRLGQDQDFKKMVLRPSSLVNTNFKVISTV